MTEKDCASTEMASVPRDPRVGTVVGERYRLLAPIGEGGMGAVYKAEHILMKKVVALKLLHAEMGQVEDAARRFEREAQSASRLNHLHIISVTDFGRNHTGELFLVMEFVPGQSLVDVIAQGRLSVSRACRLTGQILNALEHAHGQKVIHRDLKPANVMLVQNPDPRLGEIVKILDFGIAKITETGEGEQPLTKGVMIFGTPSYMSPEQATGQDVDARSDLYSCGIMLYEMLTGQKPFEHEDVVKLMAMQVTMPPPSMAAVAPDARIPPEIEAVVMRVLEKDRERRFATAAEFRAALEAAEREISSRDTRSWEMLLAGRWSLSKALGRGARILADGGRSLLSVLRSLKARLPRRIQPWAGPAVVLLLVVLAVAWGHSCRRGAAPSLQPPPPKPVAQDMRSPIKEIEDAMARARLAEARALIMQQISTHPEVGRVRYLLGNLEFVEKNPSAGLQAYEEALRLDPGLRGDAALLVNVRSVLSDKKLGQPALDLLINQIGVPARAILAEIASEDRRVEFRREARKACESLGCAEQVDKVQSYALDLAQGRNCAEKRAAVEKLGETRDKRAIEPLRKARYGGRGGLLGRVLGAGGNACIIKDIDDALRKLGVEPPARKRR